MKCVRLATLLALSNACQSPTEQRREPQNAVVTDVESTDVKALCGPDTLRVSHNIVLNVMPGSRADFPNLSTGPSPETTENHLIRHQGNGRVQREGDNLFLTLTNGKSIVFANDTYQLRHDENEELDKYYKYRGNLPGLPYWIIEEELYEAQTTFLVNQQNGTKTALTGELELSPDHTHLLMSYSGMVYEGDVHELQLFTIDQQAVHLLWQRSLREWAPGQTHWLNNQTIAVEQLRLDMTSDSASFSQPTYIRLLLPK